MISCELTNWKSSADVKSPGDLFFQVTQLWCCPFHTETRFSPNWPQLQTAWLKQNHALGWFQEHRAKTNSSPRAPSTKKSFPIKTCSRLLQMQNCLLFARMDKVEVEPPSFALQPQSWISKSRPTFDVCRGKKEHESVSWYSNVNIYFWPQFVNRILSGDQLCTHDISTTSKLFTVVQIRVAGFLIRHMQFTCSLSLEKNTPTVRSFLTNGWQEWKWECKTWKILRPQLTKDSAQSSTPTAYRTLKSLDLHGQFMTRTLARTARAMKRFFGHGNLII